ncbi:hypothetical protein WR25_14210 [Diploscapter pachys]|uniref:GST C-terminal domain-containing protein n=1 Tax=Diploscapter pachys TaxID=2018661 RepID=A0A2A2LMG5_9BILA|nr:hypothetical protein WR25_14210 [Diploscapter pachys]
MSCCCCCPATLAIGAVVIYLIYKFFFKKERKEPELQVQNWEKDTVYLFQFSRPQHMPNLSPFCLKVETLLRAHKIKHEIRETTKLRSKYGLLPFIELNGKHYADSQLIDFVLREHFKIDQYATKYDEGVARAIDRMIDSFTFGEFCQNLVKILHLPSVVSAILGGFVMPLFIGCKFKQRVNTIVGPFSQEEFLLLFRKDMEAVANVLGDKKYLFGDKITSADCTLWALLAISYYASYEVTIQRIIREEFKPIQEYLDRIRHELYPDDFSR